MCLILKPLLWYIWITCLIDVAIVATFSFLISSVVQKCMLHDVVTMNGTLLMYIMSVSSVTCLCLSSMPVGRSSYAVTTQLIFFLVVLPCSDPMSFPKISLAHNISPFVTGQLGIMLFSIYVIKSAVVGCPIISCRERAHTASKYSLMVYLDLFLATVFTKTCPALSCTSEKNIPFLEGLNTQVILSAL